MDAYYITFQSMTQAQTAMAVLQRQGIMAEYLRAPRLISSAGCGYALELKPSDIYGAMFILRNREIFPGKVFRITRSGDVREVFL